MAINDDLYEVNDKGERVVVKSLESRQRAYLRFLNRTSRPVDVWWRDYQGARRHYVRLQPGNYYNINTFITHAWEFTDASTRERYVINNKPIFRAPRCAGGMMFRTNWNITVAVRTLRDTAMLEIAKHLHNPSLVSQLDLPRVVASELRELVRILNNVIPIQS